MMNLRLPLAAALVAFCGSFASAADYTMKIATEDAPVPGQDHYLFKPLDDFKAEVEAKSEGRISVQIFLRGQLGKTENVLNMVRDGLVEASLGSDGHIAPYFPEVQVLGIPYLFLNRDIAYKVLDGPFGQELSNRMATGIGIRPMVWFENGGYRHYSASKPIESAADMQGMKIRTMNNPTHMEIVRSLGASPTPINWADLYTALQTGVVDGQENALPTFRVARLEEVQKHIILDGHVYSLNALFVNEKWLESLPEDLRKIVDEAAATMLQGNREISIQNEISDREYLEASGVTIYEPDQATKEKFRDMTQEPVLASIRGNVDPALLDLLFAEIEKAEAAAN